MPVKNIQSNISLITVWWLIILFFGFIILHASQSVERNQQFTHLADSFLAGQLHFKNAPVDPLTIDYVVVNDKLYWPEAPLAAVLLMPFVYLFGPSHFAQAFMHVLLLFGVFYLVYKLSLKYRFRITDSLWFAFAFCFASVIVGVAFIPWCFYFAQILSVFLLLLAIYEFHSRRRWVFIGAYISLAIAARYTLVVSPLFFILYIFLKKGIGEDFQKKLKNIALFLLPIFFVGAFLLLYNYARFENVWETGYSYANTGSMDAFLFEKYSLFQIKNIPSNFYYYFINMPKPVYDGESLHLAPPYLTMDEFGMSFFVVSPIFLYIFTVMPSLRKKPLFTNLLWVVSILQLVLLLSYYSPGSAQFGSRYMIDLLPWLLILLFLAFKERGLSRGAKTLILLSAFLNFFLLIQVRV